MSTYETSSSVPYETMTPPPAPIYIRAKRRRPTARKEVQENKGPSFRPWTFYLGLLMSIVGSLIFLCSISSSYWVNYSAGSRELPIEKRKRLIAHYGPWEGCNHGNECGPLWELVPGLNESPVRLTQTMFSIAACLYIIGILLILMDVAFGCWAFSSCWSLCTVLRVVWRKIVNTVYPEMVLPVAAVTGFVSMLLMGQLKHCVILREHQREHIGDSLFACIAGVVITVFGVLFALLNRFATDNSKIAQYLYSLRRKKRTRTCPRHLPCPIRKPDPELGGGATGDTSGQLPAVDASAVVVVRHGGGEGGEGGGEVQSPPKVSVPKDASASQRQTWVSAPGVMKEPFTSEI